MADNPVEVLNSGSNVCSQCAAPMRYDCETRKLVCCACRCEMDLPPGIGFPMKRIAVVAANAGTIQKVSQTSGEIQCAACRGDLVFEPGNETGICPFCATPFGSLVDPSAPLLLPDAMLPVLISKETAQLKLAERLKNRRFVPDELQSVAGRPDFYGIYLPFWVYACSVQGWYQG